FGHPLRQRIDLHRQHVNRISHSAAPSQSLPSSHRIRRADSRSRISGATHTTWVARAAKSAACPIRTQRSSFVRSSLARPKRRCNRRRPVIRGGSDEEEGI